MSYYILGLPVPSNASATHKENSSGESKKKHVIHQMEVKEGAHAQVDVDLALPPSNATRRCTKCGMTETPQWRTGPQGPKTLCNACGLRYRKEEMRVDTSLSLGSLNSKMPGSSSRR